MRERERERERESGRTRARSGFVVVVVVVVVPFVREGLLAPGPWLSAVQDDCDSVTLTLALAPGQRRTEEKAEKSRAGIGACRSA
jgi:hypothetical protein